MPGSHLGHSVGDELESDSRPGSPLKESMAEEGALERIETLLKSLVNGRSETKKSVRVNTPYLGREDKGQDSANRAARCLDSFLSTYGHFKGKNVTRYLKDYESKMRVNLVDPDIALLSFITLVEESLTTIVSELLESAYGDWTLFSNKMKREFSTEDADKLTRSTFSAWVMNRSKAHGPMELLREFELKLKQLPTKDSRFIEFRKVETFLEAAGPKMKKEINRALDLFHPGRDEDDTEWIDLVKAVKQVAECRRREEEDEGQGREVQALIEEVQKLKSMMAKQGVTSTPSSSLVREIGGSSIPLAPRPLGQSVERPRVFRCIWCDSLEHAKKDCEDFKKHFKDQVVKYVDLKLAYGDSGELIPTNFGKGGMKELVEKRREKGKANTSSLIFTPFVPSVHASSGVQRCEQQTSQVEGTRAKEEGPILNEEKQRALAEYIREQSGWNCPVFISAITANVWGGWRPEEQVESFAIGEKEAPKEQQATQDPRKETETKTDEAGPSGSSHQRTDPKRIEKGKGKQFTYGREIDRQCDKGKISSIFWNQEIRGLTMGDFFGSVRKDVQAEILEKLKRKKLVKGEGGAVVGAVFATMDMDEDEKDEVEEWEQTDIKDIEKMSSEVSPTRAHYQAFVRAVERWEIKRPEEKEVSVTQVQADSREIVSSEMKGMCWARGCTVCEVEMRGVQGLVPALLDSGSEVNLMSYEIYKSGGWPVDTNCGWEVNSVNDTGQNLWGACARVIIRIGELIEPIHIFVHTTLPYSLILGQPFITELRMETKVLNDGTHVAKLKSRDGKKVVQFPTVRPGNQRNRINLKEQPVGPRVEEGF